MGRKKSDVGFGLAELSCSTALCFSTTTLPSLTSTIMRTTTTTAAAAAVARQALRSHAIHAPSSPVRTGIVARASLLARPGAPCALRFPFPPRFYSSSSQEDSAKNKAAVGPFNLRAGILFLLTGAGLLYYFQSEKAAVDERRRAETAQAKVGRPRIGGPFQLVTASGHPFTHEDLQGSFSLVYFGFTNCPDICPEELDKMGEVVERIDAEFKQPIINPVFISCDPARDTIPQLRRYIEDFHPRMVGLTGPFDAVKAACKAYRVYFSTPPEADPTGDYLVDHSIFFYLMDPEGKFVDAFGRSADAKDVGDKVHGFVKQWLDAGLEIKPADAKNRAATDGRPTVDEKTMRLP